MTDKELKDWIEMNKLRTKSFDTSVWIPLYEETNVEEEKIFNPGYKEDLFFVRSLLVPIEKIEKIKELNWSNLGSGTARKSYVNDDGKYISGDIYDDSYDGIYGIFPVLDQNVYHNLPSVWHLNQDIVIALKLFRDGDKWICPDEDYAEVAHLIRKENGEPQKLEIRNEFLKDYLCARNMVLRLVTYRDHDTYLKEKPNFGWNDEIQNIEWDDGHWEGRINETTNNGNPIGSSALIVHEKRIDVDKEEDVPVMGKLNDDSVELTSKTVFVEGNQKVYRVEGEIWKNEIILPGKSSPRIKGDEPLNLPSFKIDSQGTVKTSKELIGEDRWLWFNPNIINLLLSKKDGKLEWNTRETGRVSCSDGYFVPFGINELGLITVFAEDIYNLPVWQQNIWAGSNVAPDGGVSKELMMSQVDAEPADTQAPEEFLPIEYNRLNEIFKKVFNVTLFRHQQEIVELLPKINRFQSLTEEGFFCLAKDLARITADGICLNDLQKEIEIPKDKKWGSLKTLQNFFIQRLDFSEEGAKKLMAPLFGIYDLRQVDAHLGDPNKEDPFESLGVDKELAPLFRGTAMLSNFVTTLCIMSQYILKKQENR